MIEDYLKEGSTQQEITEEIAQLCQYTSESIQPICTKLVEDLMPYVIQYLEQDLEEAQVCVLIGLCKD